MGSRQRNPPQRWGGRGGLSDPERRWEVTPKGVWWPEEGWEGLRPVTPASFPGRCTCLPPRPCHIFSEESGTSLHTLSWYFRCPQPGPPALRVLRPPQGNPCKPTPLGAHHQHVQTRGQTPSTAHLLPPPTAGPCPCSRECHTWLLLPSPSTRGSISLPCVPPRGLG